MFCSESTIPLSPPPPPPQISSNTLPQYKDLPNELPSLLVVGTKVTARLASAREHESGFYTGTVDAVDIDKHRYWVTFDRPGLGNHLIPDTEIRVRGDTFSVSHIDTLSLIYHIDTMYT